MANLILLNKPFDVLCQFTDGEGRPTLADYVNIPNVYPAGRLDRDSEGLVLLTDNGALQHRISSPDQKMPKTYWVLVEGQPDAGALDSLRRGVSLNDGRTRPAQVRVISPPDLPERSPPVRHRPSIQDTWLEMTLTEGRNRQVRRMTAAVGHPTLRLFRFRIGPWTAEALAPGEFRQVTVHLPEKSTEPGRGRRGPRGPARGERRGKTATKQRRQTP